MSYEAQLTSPIDIEVKNMTNKEIYTLNRNQHLQDSQADKFYQLKRSHRKKFLKCRILETITLDFQISLPPPNVSINDVHYKRQFSFDRLNIHFLSDKKPVWYTYDKTVAKK